MLLISEPRTVLYSISEELGGSNPTSSLTTRAEAEVSVFPDCHHGHGLAHPNPRSQNTDADSLSVIDVGSNVLLDASTTPNRSGK